MSTASGLAELVSAAGLASAPVGIGRRFSFIGLDPHVGVSTVAALTCRALAAGRNGRTLLAGALLDPTATTAVPSGLADTLPQHLRDRLTFQHGIFALPLIPPPLDSTGRAQHPGAAQWREQVAPAARYFDILGTDWENGADLPEILDRSLTGQAVCVVAPYERTSAEYSVALARALHNNPDGPAVMVAFVDAEHTFTTWPRMVAERVPFPVVRFHHDVGIAVGRPPNRQSVRSAILSAAQLMHISDPSGN